MAVVTQNARAKSAKIFPKRRTIIMPRSWSKSVVTVNGNRRMPGGESSTGPARRAVLANRRLLFVRARPNARKRVAPQGLATRVRLSRLRHGSSRARFGCRCPRHRLRDDQRGEGLRGVVERGIRGFQPGCFVRPHRPAHLIRPLLDPGSLRRGTDVRRPAARPS